MDIYIIRHGETAFNVGEERIRGRKDIPLSDFGIQHAEEVSKKLTKIPIEKIYHSKLSRTKVTAEKILQNQNNAEIVDEPLLLDISFGEWEGKKGKDVFTEELQKQWKINPNDVLIPGGETFYQVLDRLHRLFLRLRKQTEKTIALVTHGAVINLIFVYLTETHPSHYWDFYVKPCSISHIKLNENGKMSIIKFNDVQHLTE